MIGRLAAVAGAAGALYLADRAGRWLLDLDGRMAIMADRIRLLELGAVGGGRLTINDVRRTQGLPIHDQRAGARRIRVPRDGRAR